jgi:hypothetical protein
MMVMQVMQKSSGYKEASEKVEASVNDMYNAESVQFAASRVLRDKEV